jgi:DNA-directed RNA polymerase subunit F
VAGAYVACCCGGFGIEEVTMSATKKDQPTSPLLLAAAARQVIRDEALQFSTLAPQIVAVIVERIDEIDFEDSLAVAEHARFVSRAARDLSLLDDEESVDAADELRSAINRMRERLNTRIRDVRPADRNYFEEEMNAIRGESKEGLS